MQGFSPWKNGGMGEYESLRKDISGLGSAVESAMSAQGRLAAFQGSEIEKLWRDNDALRDDLHAVANRLERLTAFVTSDPAEVAAKIVNDANRATLHEVKRDD